MDKAKFIKSINGPIFHNVTVEDLDYMVDQGGGKDNHPRLSMEDATALYQAWLIYKMGWTDGYDDGYESGHLEGFNKGYGSGYEDGLQASR
jgi:hypothetical protein